MVGAGAGAGLDVVVSVRVVPGVGDGCGLFRANNTAWRSSAPKPLFQYYRPVITSSSRTWGVGGTRVNVSAFNLGTALNMIRCRVGDTGPGELPLPDLPLPGSTITCALPSDSPTGVGALQLSNDGGVRWGSACVVQTIPQWHGGRKPTDGAFVASPLVMRVALVLPSGATGLDEVKAADAFGKAIGSVNSLSYLGAGSTLLGTVSMFSTPAEAVRIATALVNGTGGAGGAGVASDNLVGIVGGYLSRNAIPMADVATAHMVPFLAIGATASVLSSAVTYPYFARLCFPSTYMVEGMVAFLKRMHWEKGVALLTTNDPYSTDVASMLTGLLEKGARADADAADGQPSAESEGSTGRKGSGTPRSQHMAQMRQTCGFDASSQQQPTTTTTTQSSSRRRRRNHTTAPVVYRGVFNGSGHGRTPADMLAAAMPHAINIAAAKPRVVFIESDTLEGAEVAAKALASLGIFDTAGCISSYYGGGASWLNSAASIPVTLLHLPAGTFFVSEAARPSYVRRAILV